jgi:hypothetical protein
LPLTATHLLANKEHGFANGLPVTAKHLPTVADKFAGSFPVRDKHLPTV